jgi:hypothetical protein
MKKDDKSSDLEFPENLLNDTQVARLLNFSVAWVRKERWKRKTGQTHVLGVDPVIIGNKPRYRFSDIQDWIKQQ